MNWNVGVFERFCNTILLALSFVLFLYLLNVNQMEKREWCATYISAAQCRCQSDTSQLLNESVDIKLPPSNNATDYNFLEKDLKRFVP
jgi:hypothetical protein